MPDRRARILAVLRALAWLGLFSVAVGALLSINPLYSDANALQSQLSDETILVAASLALSWGFLRLEGKPLNSLGLHLNRGWFRQFGQGVLLGGAVILVAALATALLAGVRWRAGTPAPATLASGVGLYLAVAWAEELHYRGYPFQRLCEALGPWAVQAVFAVYFVLGHWQNPGMAGTTRLWAALNIGLASLLLGYAWLRTGSLALSLGIHFGWNFVQGPLLGFGVSGTRGASVLEPVLPSGATWLHGGGFGLEAGLLCAVSCLAAFILVARFPLAGGILDEKEQPCRDGS